MKRVISLMLISLILLPIFAGMTVGAYAEGQTSVADASAFNSALSAATDETVIYIPSGTTVTASSLSWPANEATVTVTGGGILDLSSISTVSVGCALIFDGVTVIFKSGATVYANGYSFTIKENVTVTNAVTLYGGSNGGTINGTDLYICSGTYNKIYGGSNGGTINGNTNVYIGGNTNPSVNWQNHSGGNNYYGGGTNDNITGDTNITVAGNAKANYIYGGSTGSASKIGGTSTLRFSENAKTMSIYAASHNVNTGTGSYLIMTGGEAEQVFGGSESAGLGSDSSKFTVTIKALGGKISRRLYGGCYNGTSALSNGNFVNGSITVFLGEGLEITYDATDPSTGKEYDDQSVIARSRRAASSSEGSTMIFTSEAAYNNLKGTLGMDSTLGFLLIFSGGAPSAAKTTHVMTYTKDESAQTITESCNGKCGSSHSAVMSVSLDENMVYDGTPKTPAAISYGSGWISGSADAVSYENNINAGTATVGITLNEVQMSLDFEIANAEQTAPELTVTDESICGKADGAIGGLSCNMEYSTAEDGEYLPVSDANMGFASGTYYVRYKAKTNYNASPAVKAEIGAGRMLTVTFRADGEEIAVREVSWNETLSDIPAVPKKTGYSGEWENISLADITTDLTVNAVYTVIPNQPQSAPVLSANNETIYGKADGSITGLTADMEIKTGLTGTYVAVTDPDMTLASGVYYVRYAAKEGYDASAAVKVQISAGRKLTVTFKAEGAEDIVKEIGWNETLTDIPSVPEKEGYTGEWKDAELSGIKSDMTVNAVYTQKENLPQSAPVLSGVAETVYGKGDGAIVGLTEAMEYSLSEDGTYTAVTDPDVPFAHGTYYVRYAAKEGYNASPATKVVIGEGRMLTVTFKAEGREDVVKEVAWGGTLTDIPALPEKEGGVYSWNVNDFSDICSDITVTAVYTVNVYKVYFKIDGETVATRDVAHGAAVADIPEIPAREGYTASWDKELGCVKSELTVNAVYTIKKYTVTFKAEGEVVDTVVVDHGSTVAALPEIPAKVGYNGSWDTQLGEITSDVTVNAVYTIKKYTVVFMANGEVLDTFVVEHGDTIAELPETPEKDGYNGSWDTQLGEITSDITVTAVYSKKENLSQSAPILSAVGETIYGKKDGKINGLTSDMEYSTANNGVYTPILDLNASFAPGTYYVRYAAKEGYNASPAVKVEISEGRMLTVTFKAEGAADIVKKVEWKGALSDIPAVPEKYGYTGEWEAVTLSDISTDITVNAVYTIKKYTVTFKADGEVVDTVVVDHGSTVAKLPEIPSKEGHNSAWDTQLGEITADVTVNAVYTIRQYTVTFKADGEVVDTVVVDHGATVAELPEIPEKKGYTAEWESTAFDSVKGHTIVNAVYTKIPNKPQSAPVLSASDETVSGKNDGMIVGLTTRMEYSKNNKGVFIPVTDVEMLLAPGTYYVRYAAKEGYDASPAVKVKIGEGRMLSVSFYADGKNVSVYGVCWNGNLSELPEIPEKAGHSKTAPYWDITALENIQTDITVNAVYTVDEYTVTFIADGETVATFAVIYGGELADIPTVPAKDGYTAAWDMTHIGTVSSDVTVTAVYTLIPTEDEITPPEDNEPEQDVPAEDAPQGSQHSEDGENNTDGEQTDKESGDTTQSVTEAVKNDNTAKNTEGSEPTAQTGGCGSSVAYGMCLVSAITAGAVLLKKKED